MYTFHLKNFRKCIKIRSRALYETFWNFIDTLTRHEFRDYIDKICRWSESVRASYDIHACSERIFRKYVVYSANSYLRHVLNVKNNRNQKWDLSIRWIINCLSSFVISSKYTNRPEDIDQLRKLKSTDKWERYEYTLTIYFRIYHHLWDFLPMNKLIEIDHLFLENWIIIAHLRNEINGLLKNRVDQFRFRETRKLARNIP